MSPSSKRRRPPTSPPAATAPAAPPDDPEEPDWDDDEPDGQEFSRLGAGAGVAYALVGFIGSSLLPVGAVDPEDSAQAAARQFTAERGRISAGVLLTVFSLFFLLVFVCWLYRWLREVEGPRGWLATLSLGGGLLTVGAVSVVVLLSLAGTVLEDYGGDAVMARTLLLLQWQAVAVAFIPTAAFVGATSLVGYTRDVLPRWLTYSGLIIALGLLLPPIAFFPFLLSNLWTGMLAVVLLQRVRAG
ncbi:MAG: DUF4386 family protein [Acidimicrobiales bacterium]